jgi:hypothetical protein
VSTSAFLPQLPVPSNASKATQQKVARLSVALEDVSAFSILRGFDQVTTLPTRQTFNTLSVKARTELIVRHIAAVCASMCSRSTAA